MKEILELVLQTCDEEVRETFMKESTVNRVEKEGFYQNWELVNNAPMLAIELQRLRDCHK